MADNQHGDTEEFDDDVILRQGLDQEASSVQATEEPEGKKARSTLKEYALIILYALLIAFILKTFVIRGFYIPSGSMENTLHINDRVFVNVAEAKFSSAKRGDVIVFKDTKGWMQETSASSTNPITETLAFIGILPDTSQNYLVKRVIGVGGDHVVYNSKVGKVTVNGQEITEPYIYPGASPSDIDFDVIVPDNSYFVMGDHRNNSADSRYHISTNNEFISDSDVVGNVFVVAFPFDHFGFLPNESSVFANVPANG